MGGKGSEVLCIQCDEAVAGFLVLRYGGNDSAWIEEFYVRSEHRGRAVGTTIFREVERTLKERGVLAIFVDVIPRNEDAL